MRELLVATSNKGKLAEILEVLRGVPFQILTLADVNVGGDVEETEATLEGNAILKARTYGVRTGKWTIAEDTGLEVDVLGGGPGVKTARYAEGSDDDRNQKLLRELQDVPNEKRTARFCTVAAIYDPTADVVRTAEGECRGKILREYRGNKSFGFGPLFFSDELGQTLSEVETDVRNSVSHRGRALKKARDILLAEFV